MPRKALALVRAALRFAQEADDERGAAQPRRRGIRTLARRRPEERTKPQCLTRRAFWQTTNVYEIVRDGDRQTGITWLSLCLVGKPVHCGSAQAACPSGNEVQISAWGMYAPFTQGACHSRYGLDGVEFLELVLSHFGKWRVGRTWAKAHLKIMRTLVNRF